MKERLIHTGRVIAAGALAALSAMPVRADVADEIERLLITRDIDTARSAAVQARKEGKPEGWYYCGRIAMLDFDFPEAKKCFAEFRRLSRRSKSPAIDSLKNAVSADELRLKEASLQFDRFQDIVVIDAVRVKRDDFFKNLRLPLSAGRVVDADELPALRETKDSELREGSSAYISEGGDLVMWSAECRPDSVDADNDGVAPDTSAPAGAIAEANVLADGTLSEPRYATGLGDNPSFPFLSADGTTVYFSSDGPDSIGGLDIFITSRDPQTGEYLHPVNAGMPFNSTEDDYLMAIDEENGVGWWATDRKFLPDDEIMLYVYILPEGRVNFEGSDEEKRQRALLDDYRVTWLSAESAASDEDEDDENDDEDGDGEKSKGMAPADSETQEEKEARYERLAADIRSIKPGQKPRRTDCRIPLPGMKFIYSADDVKTAAQKELVKEYIALEKEYSGACRRLDSLRRQYARSTSEQTGREIQKLEQQTAEMKMNITALLSNLYRSLR